MTTESSTPPQQLSSFMAEMNELLRAVPRGGSTGLDLEDDAPTSSTEHDEKHTEVERDVTVGAHEDDEVDPPS